MVLLGYLRGLTMNEVTFVDNSDGDALGFSQVLWVFASFENFVFQKAFPYETIS